MLNKDHVADPKDIPNASQGPTTTQTLVVAQPGPQDIVDQVKRTEKKATVLETHGYILGKNIGQGSYAIVKVNF